MADAAHWFLAKYHDMISFDPVELGCTHSAEHMIKVTDETAFKERFRQIPNCWLRRLGITCGKCWNLVPSDPARVLGAMQWCWCARKMVAYSSVSTFAA